MRKIRLSGGLGHIFAAAAFAVPLSIYAGSASAAQYQLVHTFCQDGSCHDGRNPQDGLVRDGDGNFFGTGNAGGKSDHGVAFELKFNSSTQQYDYLILHHFCSRANCADGAFPDAPLIVDTNGNLYGTATQGGASNSGIVFELVQSEGYALHLLHNFCTAPGCQDGSAPITGLTYQGQQNGALYDGTSPLYGATERTNSGGGGFGVVYELKGAPQNHYILLHTFCLTDCTDGEFPSALTIDGHGHLYGVGESGGANNGGVLFEIHPRTKELSVLYTFCSKPDCADGKDPDLRQRPVLDEGGRLYGTTFDGGKHNMGTVFKFTPRTGKLAVLYSFCALASCADGASPRAGVTLGSGGEVFGTTPQGGTCDVAGGCGVVFELQGSTYSLLHSFCADGDPCPTDGAQPFGELVQGPSGTLFGMTELGGAGGGALARGGTAFSVTP